MGCTHTSGCPLFPRMNASLRGWRDAYCDSTSEWRDCARYRLSLTGRPVPLTLLPNGRDAQALLPAGPAGPARPRFATSRRVVLDPAADSPFEAVPAGPRPVAGGRATVATLRPVPTTPRPASAVEPVPPPRRRPAATPAPSPAARRPAPATPRASWWSRLADWMRAPA